MPVSKRLIFLVFLRTLKLCAAEPRRLEQAERRPALFGLTRAQIWYMIRAKTDATGGIAMDCIGKITEDILWVGGNDRRLNLFENAFPVPRGVSYNAYLVLDERTVLLDTVDRAVAGVFFDNLAAGLKGRPLDFVIMNHMEPDHCATLGELCRLHPETTIIVNPKTAGMIDQFYTPEFHSRYRLVKEGETLETGRHRFMFFMAPMVHWPEVMVTYDEQSKTLFSADAFGTFGAVSGFLFADEVDFERDWLDEARRYYANIVGKYGAPVQMLLSKAEKLDIQRICPLHGPIWRKNLAWYIDKYQKWSAYEPESDGALIVYASIYGHTQNAAEALAMELRDAGVKTIAMYDVSVTHPSYLVGEAFRLKRLAFCSSTYNAGIFPAMEALLLDLKAHKLQNRTVALMENGSWAPAAAKLMREILSEMKNVRVLENIVSIQSSVKAEQRGWIRQLAQELAES